MATPLGALVLILATQSAPAPPAASVAGVIRDAASGEPLAGAVVALTDLDRFVDTDDAGGYEFPSVPAGPQHVVVQRIGYRSRTLHILVPTTGRLEFDVSLLPSPVRLDPLPVTPVRPVRGLDPGDSAVFPARGITQAAIRNHPTLAQADPLLALAGGEVLAEPEAPTGVYVRGGGSDHTGYLLDGIPVFNPYHVGGLFSAWNPDAIGGLQLDAAGPSPALPDALSGAIAARTREPGGRLRVQTALSNAEARLTLDGPAPGSASYLVSWRAGLVGALVPKDEASYVTGETGDFLASVRVPALGGNLRALWYESENEVGTAAVVLEPGSTDPLAPRNAFAWASRSVGAEWSRSASRMSVQLRAWSAAADASAGWHGGEARSELHSAREDHGLQTSVERRSGGARSEAGIRFRRLATSYRVRATPQSWRVNGSRTLSTAFAQHAQALTSTVELWGGASATVLDGRLHIAPRGRLRWRAADRLTLTGTVSRLHQFAQSLRNPESIVGHVFPPDLFLAASVGGVPVPQSDQVVLAAELRPAPGVRVGAQAFTRRLDGVVLVTPGEAGPYAEGGFTIGAVRARGASLELAASGRRHGLVASYGVQRVRAVAGDAGYTPAHGTTHSLDGGLSLFPGATTSVRLAISAAAGRSAAAFGGPFEWETCNVLDQGCEFAGSPELSGPAGATRLPVYARVDIGARKHWHATLRGHDVLVGLFGTVSNLLGRYNTLAYVIDSRTGERRRVEMLPRTPLVVGIDARF